MKALRLLLTTVLLSACMGLIALAGSWQSDEIGLWYLNDDNTYFTDGWAWIDGDSDGFAECYYFDSEGYCLTNITAPDGSLVDSSGAWIVDGVVQTAAVETIIPAPQETPPETEASVQHGTSVVENSVPDASATVWIPATGTKYHRINSCGRMNPSKARAMSRTEAEQRGYTPCSKCY